jgi:glycosyltransferase involved in cell wall biosynthesis
VTFLGALPPDATTAVIDRARVVVVPSRWPEPFGMVGVESMLRGRPVVAARHGGIPEWLHEGEAGVGFRPGDHADLAAAIRQALAPGSYERRASAGARLAATAFPFEAMIDAVERELRAARSAPEHPDPEPWARHASCLSG